MYKRQEPAPAPAAPAPAAAAVNTEEKVLNIYNWADYISANMVADFEKETGIKVNYQTFENNEGLHAKLVAGNSGFDLVVPGAVFAKSQIDGRLLMKLDKTLIPNLGNLDPDIMGKLATVDPGNDYLVPWAWSYTTAVSYTNLDVYKRQQHDASDKDGQCRHQPREFLCTKRPAAPGDHALFRRETLTGRLMTPSINIAPPGKPGFQQADPAASPDAIVPSSFFPE